MYVWYNIPLLLTASRLLLPFVYVFFLYYTFPLVSFKARLVSALFFLALALTDFFDGYLARFFKQETLLGKILDPLADKVFTISLFITLVALQEVYFFWALIFIIRDVVISGLRQIALQNEFDIPVSWWGKIKTFFLCFYLFCVLGHPWPLIWMQYVENILLGASLFLSLWSAYKYVRLFIYSLRNSYEI